MIEAIGASIALILAALVVAPGNIACSEGLDKKDGGTVATLVGASCT